MMRFGRKFAVMIYISTWMCVISLVAMFLHQAQPGDLFTALGILGSGGALATAWEDGKKAAREGSDGAS